MDTINGIISNNLLEINISGYYGISDVYYEYELKTVESRHLLTVRNHNEFHYKKILSDNEYYDIYNFIKEHEMEQNINERIHAWTGSEDFKGSIKIMLDNNIYENKIYSQQEFENNMYKILIFLDNYIEESNYKMPIRGVFYGY